jgi:hypothetical protein
MRVPTVCVLLCWCSFCFTPRSAVSQAVRVGRQNISRQRITPEIAVTSVQVTVSPVSVTFHLVSNGVATASGAITVTTTSGICLLTCTIQLYGYFSSATAALSGGSPVVNIPSSSVLGQMPTGTPTSYTSFTQSGPFGGAGASLLLFTQAGGTSRTDSLNLQINLASQPQLPAGSYSGTLNIQAQSF